MFSSSNSIDYHLHYVQNVCHISNERFLTPVNSNFMRIFYMNCRSLNCRIEEIQHLLISLNSLPDILAFDETWIKDEEIEYFQFNGYIPFLAGRSDKRGGGVGIFVKINWGTPRILEKIVNDLFEGIVVEVKLGREIFNFIVIYRPPVRFNNSQQQFYLSELENILSRFSNGKCVVLGDHNIDLMFDSNPFVQDYINLLLQFNKVVLNKGFVTRPSSGTCIDHVVVDYECVERVKIQTLEFLDLNHLVMFIDIPYSCFVMNTEPLYIVKKILDYDRFKHELPCRLDHVTNELSVDEIFDEISNVLKNTKDDCSFVKVFRRRKRFKCEWVDDELIDVMNTRDFWYKKHKSDPTNVHFEEQFKCWRNKVTLVKRTKKQEIFAARFLKCGDDKRKIWDSMKFAMTNGQHSHSRCNLLSSLQDSDQKQVKINEFNDFYASIGDNFAATSSDSSMEVPSKIVNNHFKFHQISLQDTKNVILSLKNKNSCGYDGISPILLKSCCDEVSHAINILINKSLTSGKFPRNAKLARVIGIYKSGNSDDVANFRPISVTPIIGKVIEMVVNVQLSNYLEENDVLTPEQYGFRIHSNTMSACFDLASDVCRDRDDSKLINLTFVDTSKAFNSVHRNHLLEKLKKIGVLDNELDWFKSFLSGNFQYSECDGFSSDSKEVKTGLMQGSILSPLLFNVYSCDLALMNFNGKFYCYADDICFKHSGTSVDTIEELIDVDMKKFERYMNSNFLTVNASKSKSMTIGNTNSKIIVRYCGRILENVDEFRYLGLLLNSRFDWNSHVNKLCKSLSTLAGVFRKLSNLIPENLKISLYNSMFISQVLYCLPIYGSTTNENVISVQRLQNRAIKNLFNKNVFYSPIRLLNELNQLSIINLFRLFSVSHIYSVISNQIHSNSVIVINSNNYNTRSSNRLWKHQIHSKTWGENNPLLRAIDLYNNLDDSLTSMPSVSLFKRKLKRNLLDSQASGS